MADEIKTPWYKSRGFVTALGLVIGALVWFLQSYNVVNSVDVVTGTELAPGVDQVYELAKAGQWASALTALIGVLMAYFRAKARGPLGA